MDQRLSRRAALGLAAGLGAIGLPKTAAFAQTAAGDGGQGSSPPEDKNEFWFTAVTVSADGRLIAGASTSRAIGIWELSTGRLIKQLMFPETQNSVGALAFTPDGERLLVGNVPQRRRSKGQALLEYEIASGDILNQVSVDPNWVYKIATCAAVDWFATAGGGYDRSLRIWKSQGLQPHHIWPAHDSAVLAVAISPNGARIVTGGGYSHRSGRDPSVRIWDARTAQQLHKLGGHTQSIVDLVITADGRRLISLSSDTVQVWALGTGKLLSRTKLVEDNATAKRLSPDGRYLISVTTRDEGILITQTVASGRTLLQTQRKTSLIEPVMISPDSALIIVGGVSGAIEIYTASTGAFVRRMEPLRLPTKPQ